jgi:soluble lytic murein transglycosylase
MNAKLDMGLRREVRIQFLLGAAILTLAMSLPPFRGEVGAASAPGAPEPELAQAAQEARKGRWEEVITLLRAHAGREGETGGRVSLLLGYALLQRGLSREAAGALARAARLHPLLGDLARFYEAEAWMAQGNYPEAIQRYRAVIASSPRKTVVAKALLRQGEALLRAGEPGNAVVSLTKALQASGGAQDRIWFLLGGAYGAAGKPREALAAYVYAYRAFPGSPYERLAEERIRALEAQTGLRATIPAGVRFRRAVGFLRRGNLRAAEEAFRAVLGSNPPPPLLSESLYRLGQVRLSLGDPEGAVRAFARGAAIPGKWRSANLYWQGVALLRLGQEEDARKVFRSLTRTSPTNTWAGRALFQWSALELRAGRWREADRLLEQVTRQFPGPLQWEALWRRSWLRIERGKEREAEGFLHKLAGSSPSAHQASRALYWAATLEAKRGAVQQAREHLEYVARTFPLTYYGQRARAVLGFPPPRFLEEGNRLSSRVLGAEGALGRVLELADLGLVSDAVSEAEEIRESEDLGLPARSLLARVLHDLGVHDAGISFVEGMLDWSWERGELPPRDLWELAYPLGFWDQVREAARRFGLDPRLLLAVIREESRFNPHAVSPAGAVGLMQVMPSTGKRMAGALGFAGEPSLLDPGTNLLLGAAYLRHLLERFGGNVMLAIAGYNAGPGTVSRWWERFQNSDKGFGISDFEYLKSAFRNPQSETRDFVWFIETIPYTETREYVKRVLQSYGIYRALWP